MAPDQSTPEGLRATWLTAVHSGDAESLRPLLTDDYEGWANGAPPLTGVDAAVDAMRAAMQRYRIRQEFDVAESVTVSEWAFERGIERIEITPTDGGEAQTIARRALLLLRRGADGQWRYARGMTNSLPPLDAAASILVT